MTSCTRTNLSSKYFRFGEEEISQNKFGMYLFILYIFHQPKFNSYKETSYEYVIKFRMTV